MANYDDDDDDDYGSDNDDYDYDAEDVSPDEVLKDLAQLAIGEKNIKQLSQLIDQYMEHADTATPRVKNKTKDALIESTQQLTNSKKKRDLLALLGAAQVVDTKWRDDYTKSWQTNVLGSKHMKHQRLKYQTAEQLTQDLKRAEAKQPGSQLKRRYDMAMREHQQQFAERHTDAKTTRATTLMKTRLRQMKETVCLPSRCEAGTEGSLNLVVFDTKGGRHCRCYTLDELVSHISVRGYTDPTYNTPFTKGQIKRITAAIDADGCHNTAGRNYIDAIMAATVTIEAEERDDILLNNELLQQVLIQVDDNVVPQIEVRVPSTDKVAFGVPNLISVAPPGHIVVPRRVFETLGRPQTARIRALQLPKLREITVTAPLDVTELELQLEMENIHMFYVGQIIYVPTANGIVPVRIDKMLPHCSTVRSTNDMEVPLTINVSADPDLMALL